MYILKRDNLKCNDCGDCNKLLPGFTYREQGYYISAGNYELHCNAIKAALKCSAITLEQCE